MCREFFPSWEAVEDEVAKADERDVGKKCREVRDDDIDAEVVEAVQERCDMGATEAEEFVTG